MHWIDWALVVTLNGGVIIYAVLRSRGAGSAKEWFLAGRSLSWWVVGLSLFATAIDSSDIVADSGGAYVYGLSMFVFNWVGTVAGWVLVANAIVLPMYRAGMYTNAEYLETRFGPVARVLSAVVQVLYRTLVLGIITRTLFLTLSIAGGLDETAAWSTVLAISSIATAYTALGGLRSVAVTDALQSVILLAASLVVFIAVWNHAGGWAGLEAGLEAQESGLAERLLRIGTDRVELKEAGIGSSQESVETVRTPAWLVAIFFAIGGLAYAVVNHTQSMRLLGSRSEWDLRMSVVAGGVLLIIITFLNLTMGLFGRVLHPELGAGGNADSIYPTLVAEFAGVGLRGLVVAGIFAAALSTYDSIGSTLSALITRDIYARFLVKDRPGAHYVLIGRLLTPVFIFGSFAYLPLLGTKGMFATYIDLVSCFVVPLLALYLMGAFSPVGRRSGAVGLLAGSAYGFLALTVPEIGGIGGGYATAPLSLLVTITAMLGASVLWGWRRRGELLQDEPRGWLRLSQRDLREAGDARLPARGAFLPLVLGIAVALFGCYLAFVAFW